MKLSVVHDQQHKPHFGVAELSGQHVALASEDAQNQICLSVLGVGRVNLATRMDTKLHGMTDTLRS